MIMLLGMLATTTLAAVAPPEPFGPVPSPQQLAWQRMEYGMFCHFGINTFTTKNGRTARRIPHLPAYGI